MSRKGVYISERHLRQDYIDNEMSIADICEKYHTSHTNLRKLFQKYGIPVRPLGRQRKPSITKEELESLYFSDMTLEEIAEKYNMTPGNVSHYVKRYGLPARAKGRKRITSVTREELEELYLQERLSIAAVAEILGVSSATIINRLKEYGIPRRRYS